jgi:hypothetical protein
MMTEDDKKRLLKIQEQANLLQGVLESLWKDAVKITGEVDDISLGDHTHDFVYNNGTLEQLETGLARKERVRARNNLKHPTEKYFVQGGEYTDTNMVVLKDGTDITFGPYDSYQEAYDKWKSHMWLNVDNALYRLTIKKVEFKDA